MENEDVIKQEILVSKLQQRKLKLQSDWNSFLRSEWKQLDRYNQVGMFGDPVKREKHMSILPWVWTYLYKDTDGEDSKDATK